MTRSNPRSDQDPDRATALLARVQNQTLDEAQRDQLADALANAADLERALHADHVD